MMLPVDNKPWGWCRRRSLSWRTWPGRNRAVYAAERPASAGGRWAKLALEQAKAAAEAMEKEIDDQFVDCNWAQQTRAMIRSAARLGTGVMKGPFPKMLQERSWLPMEGQESVYQLTIIERMAPWCACVDVWDFFLIRIAAMTCRLAPM